VSVVTFGSNIASLKAQRQLGKATADVRTVSERLSSGLRINHASDDAAGLSIASALNADRRVLDQGIRNLNDGISLLNVADGATEQLSTILIRLKELAEQAANGTYGSKQRKALDSEAQALSKEYFRIVQTTSFNGQSLFSPSMGQLGLQGGYGSNGAITGSLGGAAGTGGFGTYSDISDILASRTTPSVALGDINGDGELDLVDTTRVALGRGNGTFQTGVTYDAAGGVSVLVRDFNNDGFLDILDMGSGHFTVFLGNGNGTFRAGQTSPLGLSSYSLAAADFNGDGILDLVRGQGDVVLSFGRGDGTFDADVTISTGYIGRLDYSLGDINRDGVTDIVTTGYHSGSGMSFDSVFLGRGNGSFAPEVTYVTSTDAYAVKLGDVNGDGILDLLDTESGALDVRLGNANGTFGARVNFALGIEFESMALGDLNADGLLDVVSGGGENASLTVFFGNGNGSFKAAQTYTMEADFSDTIVLGDLNSDGVLDVLSAGRLNAGIRLGLTTSGISPLLSFSLESRADALQALNQFDSSLKRINTQRGTIGALQSRVGTAISNLQTSTENYASAAARITDADYAETSAELARSQIIQFASTAVLAQANQQPSLLLRLLSNLD